MAGRLVGPAAQCGQAGLRRGEERRDSSCLNDRIVWLAICWNGLLSVPMERGGSMWARWVGEAQRFEVSAPLERFDVVLRERRMSGSAERRCWRPDGTRRSRCCGVVFWFLSCRGRVGVAPWPGSRRGVGTGRRFCWWWGSLVGSSQASSIIRRGRSAARRVVRLERIAFPPSVGSAFWPSGRAGGTEVLPSWVAPFPRNDPAGRGWSARCGRAGLVCQERWCAPARAGRR